MESKTDEFQEESLKAMDYLIETSKKVLAKIKNLGVRVQPVHLDLHPHNTLFEGNELKAILDYDGCCVSELIREVGFILHRAVRQYVVNQGIPHSDRERIKREIKNGREVFFEAYEKINPLTPKEKSLLPFFIQDECLHKVHSLLNKHYLGAGTPWIKELPKQIILLKEGEYFYD